MKRLGIAMILITVTATGVQAGSSFEESLAKQIAALQKALQEKQAQAKEKK